MHIYCEDSYEAARRLVPPLIKRGLVLCDPSWEDSSDWTQVEQLVTMVRRKWNTAVIALWYPLLVRRKNETAQLLAALDRTAKTGTSPTDCLRVELTVRDSRLCTEEAGSHLYGSGMCVINPPWLLDRELAACIPFLEDALRA